MENPASLNVERGWLSWRKFDQTRDLCIVLVHGNRVNEKLETGSWFALNGWIGQGCAEVVVDNWGLVEREKELEVAHAGPAGLWSISPPEIILGKVVSFPDDAPGRAQVSMTLAHRSSP